MVNCKNNQGNLNDREYITLMEARVRTLERSISRLRGMQQHTEMDDVVCHTLPVMDGERWVSADENTIVKMRCAQCKS